MTPLWLRCGNVSAGGASCPDPSLSALQDVTLTSLYSVAAAFDGTLNKVLKESKARPLFGTPQELALLLKGLLEHQE